ncbi:Protein of unknown function [Gryllus bimaculatus]|nr:Protein of unknown function [Gryllus bimaculatus]
MKDGRWLAVPAEKRLDVYHRLFHDDPLKMQVADIVIHKCDREADEKYMGKGNSCDIVFDAMECMWQVMDQTSQKIEL